MLLGTIGNKKYFVSFKYCDNHGKCAKPEKREITTAVLKVVEDDKAYALVGSANVNSHYDMFNKKMGRKIAFTRAVSQIPDKDLRKFLWESALIRVKMI